MKDWFRKFSQKVSEITGSAWMFIIAVLATLVWLVSGPYFQYNESWNFIANTSTTIITFLMVFLIQNTQNRDAKAIHLKLDELLRATKGARNSLVNLEEMPDEDLVKLQKEFEALCKTRGIGQHAIEAIEEEKEERGIDEPDSGKSESAKD